MSVDALIGAFGRLSSAADTVVSKLGAVSEAASDAGSGLEGMGKSSADLVKEMEDLAGSADIGLWLKPMLDQFTAGKISIEEFTRWLATTRLEMDALAARGARPVLGDFEQEIQRLMNLLGELSGASRGEKKGR
ncbi:MAG: hypothetical protein JNK60_21075 [Acidobacteria bacterium]|nr:hypothetical protein [Acidobacteriota bacterium]